MKDKTEKLEARKTDLADKLANADAPAALQHGWALCERIGQLYEPLQDGESGSQAAETFRPLIDQVMLVPDNGELAIVLRGDLDATLRFAAGEKNHDFLSEVETCTTCYPPGSLAAGTRNRRYLRLVERQIPELSA
ncbi:MAG: hypothetical protein DI533_16880 [Cereibacter sphaeroides]|uniref:Uncharacterized protein n=1 Tax=Cereibacter sphaeroides TaxID=1063 RepID=A0A2W5SAE4_CERSP|nr:MAG: hypothetical protein DI533_16880 [Cereibacter sphaeroides]